MILSLGQLCSRATELAAGRSDWLLSDVSFWANAAIGEVSQVAGHQPTQAIATSSTTSGEMRYALPSDFDFALAFTCYQESSATTGSRQTTAITLTARDANWVDSNSLPNSGVPENYTTYGTWFELQPSPNSAYSLQLRYQSKHPTLIQSTETVALDSRWGMAILYKTVEMLEASRHNVEGEAMARNRYLNYVSQIPTDRQLTQRDRASMAMRFVGFGRAH